MADVSEAQRIAEFLSQKRVAVVGVAHAGVNTATSIHAKFKDMGYQVFGVNPHGGTVGDQPLYRRVNDIPGGVDGVVVVTSPAHALEVMQDCQQANVKRVWLHDNCLLPGSSSPEAVAFGASHGFSVIANGCPMMHLHPDPVHACMHWVLKKTGHLSA